MNFSGLIFHSLTIISVFRNIFVLRSILYFLIYLFLISNKLSVVTALPMLFLLIFFSIILKISFRSNLKELNLSLDNIDSIDILDNTNRR